MRKFEKFLFFYGIIAITVFFISYGLYSPRPINLISGLLMLPMVFYFWIRFTDAEVISPAKWSLRALAVIAVLTAIGAGSYYLMLKNPTPVAQKTEEADSNPDIQILVDRINALIASQSASIETQNELSGIKNDLNKIRAEGNGTSISDLLNLKITVKDTSPVNVYTSASTTSKKVGVLTPNTQYSYDTKEESWYRVNIDASITGWVEAANVKEVN